MSATPTAPATPVADATATPPAASRRQRRDRWLPVRLVAAVVVALVTLFPLYWMVVVAFTSRSQLLGGSLKLWPGELTLDNFRRILDAFPVWQWVGNSIAIALVVSLLSVAVSMLAGYAFAQLRFPGSTALFLLTVASLMIPLQVIMVPLFRLVTSMGLFGSYWAVILPTAATGFGAFLARQFVLAVPRDIIDAARIDGAGHARIFWRIVLPLCRPLLAVLFFMSLLQSWNDFAWPLVALQDNALYTLPIGLLYLQGQLGSDYGGTMAFALVSVLPMVVLFLVAQRWFVEGFARSGIR
ncbi:carbohydrate ABC transporter permease [Phycicoccus flavus]|uniref:carbohydrate ABC transporter permease n=1 Tax=Phycicoccus flavus TaxID=2502783 RepID=UPI000FEBB3D4|nr:carbohydrate ABC transporter permease [Phycicoccus flavus]NHA66605.1 carbohydrate ABC transporter permease [Phycicoccus flavus]